MDSNVQSENYNQRYKITKYSTMHWYVTHSSKKKTPKKMSGRKKEHTEIVERDALLAAGTFAVGAVFIIATGK